MGHFRKAPKRESYGRRMVGCPFCEIPKERVIFENELAYAIRDARPVTPLHTLVIPKRHVSEIFAVSRPETNAYNELLRRAKAEIQELESAVVAFNIVVNNGEASGQMVEHCHVHLIPRRRGDVENPAASIRNLFRERQQPAG